MEGVEWKMCKGCIVVDKCANKVWDGWEEKGADDDAEGEAEGMGGEGFALVETVGLKIDEEAVADLNQRGGGV